MSKRNDCPSSPTPTCTSSVFDASLDDGSNERSLPFTLPSLEMTPELTLYERMGGETQITALTAAFFQEIAQVQGLAHFFVNVPVAAIQLHQGQFFKVLFGADEEKPSADELLDYMIMTHVRLFRDLGLDASHFDLVAECFVKAMHTLQVEPNLQQECLAIVGPLRVAFDYGAAVARQEAKMSQQAMQEAPLATVKTMRADTTAKLPSGLPPPPAWLVEFLGGRDKVRAWTSALTHRMVVQDDVLKEIFFNLAYLDMEPYCHDFLQLAFANQMGNDERLPHNVLRHVRFPCGLTRPDQQLSKGLFGRIASHFFEIGVELANEDQFWLSTEELMEVTDALRTKNASFVGQESTKMHMSETERHHRLRHDGSQPTEQVSLEEQLMKKEKSYQDFKNNPTTSSTSKSKTPASSKKSKKTRQTQPQAVKVDKGNETIKQSWFARLRNNKAKSQHNVVASTA